MIGVFVKAEDIAVIISTPAHFELYNMLRARLAIFHGQAADLKALSGDALTLVGTEGLFLSALVEVQDGRGGSMLQAACERLEQCSDSKSA